MSKASRIVLLVLAVAASVAIHVKTKRLDAPDLSSNISTRMERESASPLLEHAAPSFELASITGETFLLSRLRGETVVLNFFTTWCGPCRMEMPDLARFAVTAGTRGIRVVGIDVQEPITAVKPFAESLKLTFPVLLDEDGTASGAYGVEAYPTTVLIDPAGNILAVNVGMIEDFEAWYQQVSRPGTTLPLDELPGDDPGTQTTPAMDDLTPSAVDPAARPGRRPTLHPEPSGADHT